MLPQTMGSTLSSSTSNSVVWNQTAVSLRHACTNRFLETLMPPDSRGPTRNTDYLWALLRTSTRSSFFTGGALEKEISALPPSAYSSVPEGAWGKRHFLRVLSSRISKELFFFFFCKESFIFCFQLQYTLSTSQRDIVPGAASHLYEKQFLMCWTSLGRL